MFNYTSKINPLNPPLGKMVAFATLVIDDVLEVQGFKIINGAKGLFVSPPQHKGKGTDEDGNTIEKWYDDVRFVGEDREVVSEEIKRSMIETFQSLQGTQSRVTAARSQAQVNDTASTDDSPRAANRKPLW